jgi:hypothetical protein
MKPMAMLNNIFLILLVAMALSGCGEVTVLSEVPDELDTLRSQITPGQTSRNEVQEKLGQPFIRSESWRVEVYRARSGHDVTTVIGVLPFWIYAKNVYIYALIVYDENGVVEAIDWDVYQHDPDQPLTGKSELFDIRSAMLQAGGFIFVSIDQRGALRKDLLLAPASKTPDVLQMPLSTGMCAIVLLLPDSVLSTEFYLDAKRVGGTPILSYWAVYLDTKAFTRVSRSAGVHELKVKIPSQESISHKFTCNAGQRLFIYPKFTRVRIESPGPFRSPFRYEGEVVIRDTPLESHDNWQRVLFYKGKWLGGD